MHVAKLEKAILITLSEFESNNSGARPNANDVAWLVGDRQHFGITTKNRSRINRHLIKLIDKGLVEREVGEREPAAGAWGRPPFRYKLTTAGRTLTLNIQD